MNHNTTIPRWAKWVGGLALLAIALAAGTLGLTLNVTHGLEAGLAAGIAFGLADLAKISIPLVAGLIGWTRQLKLTAAVCVAVSLWSAVNVYCDRAGQALLAREHGAEAYADKAKAIAELEAEVDLPRFRRELRAWHQRIRFDGILSSFSVASFCSAWIIFSSRPADSDGCREKRRSRMAGRPTMRLGPAFPGRP